jgi:hypothetical protein
MPAATALLYLTLLIVHPSLILLIGFIMLAFG